MVKADDLFRSGDLDGARAALVEIVRARPQDEPARMFLFQLLALVGDWDKARTHLELLARLSPEAQMLANAYGQAITAEKFRQDVFAGRAIAPILTRDADWAQDIAIAIQHFAKGEVAAGGAARDRAFDNAPDTPGRLDGVGFDWIGDADGRFGPVFEVIVAGQYGLLPFAAIESIKSEGPADLRDTIWYPVQIAYRNGQSVAAMLPARYPGSEADPDVALRTGRATAWRDGPGGQTGVGQHLLSLSTGDDRDLLSLRSLSFT